MVSISQMGRQGSRTAMAEVETQTDVATNKMNLNCETLNTEESKIRTTILCQLLKDLPLHPPVQKKRQAQSLHLCKFCQTLPPVLQEVVQIGGLPIVSNVKVLWEENGLQNQKC